MRPKGERDVRQVTQASGREKSDGHTLSEQAYWLMHRDILAGVLAPNEKLRLQGLQARYGLGMSPIREALMLLSREGLVSNEGQRGFRVTPVSVEDLQDIVWARLNIETILLGQSIRHGDADWGAEISAAFYKLTHAPVPASLDDIEEGDLVVHHEYGIGRFRGIAPGESGEEISIEYKDGGLLTVPIDHAHLVAKYVGLGGKTPELNKLGGAAWKNIRKSAEKSILE